MKTLYAACLARLGLSQSEAASLHGVRLDTIKSWSAGRNPAPDFVWVDLRKREAAIIDRSEAIREAWEDAGEIREIDIETHGDVVALLAAADFVLSANEEPPVIVKVVG